MINDIQHCFDSDYRNAHNTNFINHATTQELSIVIKELCREFYETAVKVIEDEVEYPLKRFRLYSVLLTESLNDLTKASDRLLLQISVYLGSLLEGTLQLFLLTYKHDYIESHWKQWQETDIIKIKREIKEHLKELAKEGQITSKQKNKICDVVFSELKIREEGKEVQNIMLDELIGFCKHESVFIESEIGFYTFMEDIRDSRNNIHIFTNKPLPEFGAVINNVKHYCFLLIVLINRIDC